MRNAHFPAYIPRGGGMGVGGAARKIIDNRGAIVFVRE